MTFLKSLPDADLKDVLRAWPDVGAPMAEYHQAVMRGDGPFSVGERELIAAFVSGLNACDFCYGEHTAVAEAFGIEKGLVEALVADTETAPIRSEMRPVLRYVRKLTLTPARVAESDIRAMVDAGWDDQAIYWAASICAIFNLDNRLIQGLGIPPQGPADLARTVTRLKGGGYASTVAYIRGAAVGSAAE
jgi:uncharacterized peroxidase-related enzyme